MKPKSAATTLTGQIGDVIEESALAALSLLRSRALELGLTPEIYKNTDIHIHVPSGAVPKDGPSAGVAMFTALPSIFTDSPVRASAQAVVGSAR
jgi:ATP-dependent Lon protease